MSEKAYIVENGQHVLPVEIISVDGGLYTCRLPSGVAIRLKPGRVYKTEAEARKNVRIYYKKTQYDYM